MTTRQRQALLLLIAALWLAYCLFYIYRTSFVLDGTRYFCLFDDAMISMTYARTLAQGHGLVWYQGAERVEGVTNLLWTLYLAALHKTGLPNEQMSLLVQLSALGLLGLNLWLVWRLSKRVGLGEGWAVLAVFLVAFYGPLNMWSLQGMEVAALAPLVTGALLLALRQDRNSLLLYGLLGIGTLLRPDAAVLLLVVSGFLIVTEPERRKLHVGLLVATALVFLGGQTLFRLIYYHDLFPNTYYLKMTGYPALLRMSRGLIALGYTVWNLNWLLCVLPLGLLLARPSRPVKLLLLVFVAQVAYSVYAGGDAWEWSGGANRYLAIVMPVFLVLLALTLQQLSAKLALSHRAVAIAGVVLALLLAVDLNVPSDLRGGQELPLVTQPLHQRENRDMVRLALLCREVTDPRARIGVMWGGIVPYFSERPSVDLYGKSDRHIAHLQVQPGQGLGRFWEFYPGHMKWDTRYSLTSGRPDFIPLLFPDMAATATDILAREYESMELMSKRMYWRKGSPHVRVERLKELVEADETRALPGS